MRSLFLKIFLWFFLAFALVTTALVVVTQTTRTPPTSPPPWRVATDNALTIYAQTAADIYEREGQAGLANYFERVERTSSIRAFAFDEQGHELSGRNAPQGAEELVAQAAQSGKSEWKFGQTSSLAAQPVVAPDGLKLVLVSELPRRRFNFSLLDDPRSQLFRLLAVIMTSGVVCYWLARYLTAPVVKLRTVTRQLASGDLTARVGPAMGKRRDELADLAHDFDLMAARIESLLDSQRRLLSDISHELRSPLARLNVALELARKRAGAEASSALDRIARESERLDEMIGQLLTLAHWESKGEDFRRETIDLAYIAREVAEDADFEARGRSRRVELVHCDECKLKGAEEMLWSAVENVVRNAVRYTKEGTKVEVSLRCDGDGEGSTALITVRDHGEGVPEESVGDIFRPFYRVADARDRQTGGTGLGLAITERAVRLHGGTVRASNAIDGGLIVQIRLPVKN